MKKTAVILGILLIAGGAMAGRQDVIDRDNLSIKAGPTGPREAFSLAWLEAYIYPKTVIAGKEIGVGVRTTSKVDAVYANFEAGEKKIALSSNDGKNWSGIINVSGQAMEGLHAVKFDIQGKQKKIERVVEFFVEGKTASASQNDFFNQAEILFPEGIELRVHSDCYALIDGQAHKYIAGDKLVGLYKVPWYKIIFSNGKEGWISAAMVQEPLNEYYYQGYKMYQDKRYGEAIANYKKTIAINPDYVNGHFWLAKSYFHFGDLSNAYNSIMKALSIDERNMECRIFAATLAQNYFKLGHKEFVEGKYGQAIEKYQKVIKLKPSSSTSWIELGKCYKELSFPEKAKEAWSEALCYEPANRELHALLEINSAPVQVATKQPKPQTVAREDVKDKIEENEELSSEDSLVLVRSSKTKKGTMIEAALKSVLTLTKSLGTPIKEIGWNVKKTGDRFLVSYSCRQAAGAVDAFEWIVESNTRKVMSNNSNAQTLMDRW